MTPFSFRDGRMQVEGVPVAAIAADIGTPFYCYSSAAMLERHATLAAALDGLNATIHYAIKANSNQAVIRTLAAAGTGADVVSLGEMRRALAAGIPAGRIVFSGVGKTREELEGALAAGIGQINVESESELRLLSRVASTMGATAPVSLRVNPDVDAGTHAKITTGRKEDKFGVDAAAAPAFFALAARLPGIRADGLAVHIGSQLTRLDPFRRAFARLRQLTLDLGAAGHRIAHLDLGGGIGIVYGGETPLDLQAYGDLVRETVGDLGCRLSVEPGRLLVGNAGIFVTRVVHVKRGGARRFVIVDGAMNDLIRPTLYDAHHEIVPCAAAPADGAWTPADVVGPVCESGDYLHRGCPLPEVEPGALLALMSAGAYGAVMSSTYNSRPLVAEVMVKRDRFAAIRPRQSVEALLALDRLPPWLPPAETS